MAIVEVMNILRASITVLKHHFLLQEIRAFGEMAASRSGA